MSNDQVIVKFGGSIEGLTTAVDAARASIESLAAPFTGLKSAALGFTEAFAAAFAVREIAGFAESMAALGTETSRASQILGVSTEEIGGLKLVAKASGGSLEELQTAFGRLSRNVIDETPNAKRALDALGLSFADIRNKTPEAQLELLATKFASIRDGADKDAIAIELLGRAGVNLIPILNQGAEGIRHWKQMADELGVTLDDVATGKMEAMHTSLIELEAAFEGLKIGAFLQMQGAIAGVADATVDFVKWLRDAKDAEGGAATGASLLGTAVKSVADIYASTLVEIEQLFTITALGWNDAKSAINHYGEAAKDVFRQLKDEDIAALQAIWDKAKEETAGIRAEFEAMVAPIESAFTSIASWAGEKFHAMVASASAAAPQIASAFGAAFTNNIDFRHAVAEIQKGNEEINLHLAKARNDIAAEQNALHGQLAKIWGDVPTPPERAKQTVDAHMAPAGSGAAKSNNVALETARKEIEGEMKALQEGLTLKKTVWDGEVAAHKLSKAEEYTSMMQATQKEYEGEVALLEKEKALQGQKPLSGSAKAMQKKAAEVLRTSDDATHRWFVEMVSIFGLVLAATVRAEHGLWEKAHGLWAEGAARAICLDEPKIASMIADLSTKMLASGGNIVLHKLVSY
jgi:hypothetical protein